MQLSKLIRWIMMIIIRNDTILIYSFDFLHPLSEKLDLITQLIDLGLVFWCVEGFEAIVAILIRDFQAKGGFYNIYFMNHYIYYYYRIRWEIIPILFFRGQRSSILIFNWAWSIRLSILAWQLSRRRSLRSLRLLLCSFWDIRKSSHRPIELS